MADVKSFLKTYWPSILTVVVTFLTLLTAFRIMGVNFNPVVEKHIEKVVTVEAFESTPTLHAVHKASSGDLLKQHNICKGMHLDTAHVSSMCVALDGTKPVGGSAKGPTYLTEKGKKIDYDYYTHKGTCYGNCPK